MVGRNAQGPRAASPNGSGRRRARWIVPVAALAAASITVTACGKSGGGSGGGGGGATFTYAMTGLPTSLDPANYQGDPSRDIGYEEGSTLFRWNTEALPDAGCNALPSVDNITGELAKSYTRSADGKTITVTLNDAKSSAGNQLTANDVKWTVDRLIALKVGTPATLMNDVAHWDPTNPITVVDAHTFQIHVQQESAMDLAILSWPQFRILDSTEVKKHVTSSDPWGTKFLDTTSANFGPWENSAADFDPGNKLTMHANPNYSGARGDVKTLVMVSVPDASSRAQLLQTGNANYAANLNYTQYASLKHASNVDVQVCASADRIPLILNAKNPILAKPDVRRAISMAIDRNALVKSASAGFNQPAKYGLSQSYKFTPAADGQYTYDVAGAKALMKQAGVKPFNLTLIESPARPGPEAEQIAILLKSELAQIGITIKIQTQASATDLNTTFHDGNYDAMLYLEPPAISDPYYSLFLYNSSLSGLDTFNYKNPEFDQLTAEIGSTAPGAARDALITKAAEIVVTDPPAIYLIDKQFVHAVSKGWSNYQHAPNGELFVYTLKKS
jgi:peptide/nickel transport system substrate-binding protein